MEFNQHFSRDMIFEPLKFQGRKLTDYKVCQYTSHLVRFVGYLRLNVELRNLLLIKMNQHQLLMGTGTHFLKLSSTDYSYGKNLEFSFCGIKTQSTRLPSKYRERGINAWLAKMIFLMDKISIVIRWPEVFEQVNNVRLYLKVSRLSDIVQTDGQWIHHWALHGPPSTSTLQ